MLYFAYGSNMSLKRLADRVQSARFIATATLSRHELKFHKRSIDGSGKCDIYETGNSTNNVIGVVFDIEAFEKQALDRMEGLNFGYNEKNVLVTTSCDQTLLAITYYATEIDKSLKPYHWYKEHVLRGAKDNGLPEQYVRAIEGVESVHDPQPERHEREMAIYR